jgi:hypothetical protein
MMRLRHDHSQLPQSGIELLDVPDPLRGRALMSAGEHHSITKLHALVNSHAILQGALRVALRLGSNHLTCSYPSMLRSSTQQAPQLLVGRLQTGIDS